MYDCDFAIRFEREFMQLTFDEAISHSPSPSSSCSFMRMRFNELKKKNTFEMM